MPFLRRLRVRNYKSLRDVDLQDIGSLAIFVGPNGSGKSNLLDALRFISDALTVNLDYALRERGGIGEVRRRSSGRPNDFGMELHLDLEGWHARYRFKVKAVQGYGYQVALEVCELSTWDSPPRQIFFRAEGGKLKEAQPPLNATPDPSDLLLRSVTGEEGFRQVYEALRRIAVYNPNPAAIRLLQDPDPSPSLRRDGSNLPSILRQMPKDNLERVREFLSAIVPGVTGVEPANLGPKETMVFRQEMDNRQNWRFYAQSMSDGTLRALALLVAVFQEGVPLVGIEEPEVALHPGSAQVLADALLEASRQKQVWITTHSPDLLDHEEMPPEALFAVEMRQGATQVQPIPEWQKEAIRERLMTPGEVLRHWEFRQDPPRGQTPQEPLFTQ